VHLQVNRKSFRLTNDVHFFFNSFRTHLRRVIVSRWDRVSHAEKLFAFTSAQGAYLAEQLCTFARAISGRKYALVNVHATVVVPSSVPKTHHVRSIVEACSLSEGLRVSTHAALCVWPPPFR
ncbi:unnamed protein product, partial [Ectocarpus sp. 8 AP-2014]